MFFSIPNLVSSVVEKLEKPWEFVPQTPPPYEAGKQAMHEFGSHAATRHSYLSAYEGLSEYVRVTTNENPAFRLHGVIADYDAKAPMDPVEHLTTRPGGEFMPAWFVLTASDQARLVWVFERPVMITDTAQLKAFLRIMAKSLKLTKWLAGFDSGAYGNPNQYYEIGKKWVPVVEQAFIPSAHTEMWLVQASQGLKFDTAAKFEYNVPIEDIAAEVRERFPGRWSGEFRVGARGVRFWDASADNPTGAIVRPDGMQCFTGNQPFVSWRQIFGVAFVEKYEASHIDGIVRDSAYDGKMYWMRGPEGWQDWSTEAFRKILAGRGYSRSNRGGNSEVDNIEYSVMTNRRVFRALPLMYYPPDIVRWRNESILNISKVKCLQPAPPFSQSLRFTDGRTHFPFLYKFLKTLFACEDKYGDQLTAFLSWLRYFYINSLCGTPRPGHCIVLAGVTASGKTLLGRKILGDLMGGQADGSSHMAEDSQWTSTLISAPIIRIDDQLASADPSQLKRFSARIKKYVANSEMHFNDKYVKTGDVPWFGRIIVTCNTDSESLKILPNMDMSTMDKISLFRVSDNKCALPAWEDIDTILRKELPNFARFLVDWEVPERWVSSEARFGVKSFHHPELLRESRQQGVGLLLELLVPFLREWHEHHPDLNEWRGTCTQLHVDLTIRAPGIMRDMKPRSLATQLGIMQRNGYNLVKIDTGEGMHEWRIGVNVKCRGEGNTVEAIRYDD